MQNTHFAFHKNCERNNEAWLERGGEQVKREREGEKERECVT